MRRAGSRGEIRATQEAFALAAFLLRTLPSVHHHELAAFVPEAEVLQWVRAHRRVERKELAERMAARWHISRASAYRCLSCVDAADRQAGEGSAA